MGDRILKVALIHDWLTGMRGGERCLLEFIKIYPQADVYTMIHVPGSTSAEIDSRVRGVSFLQRIPGVKYFYRWLLPLYPLAIRSLKLKNYDLVISLSHAAAKNITLPDGVKHVCFCFTPMRYIWDQAQSYFGLASYFLWPIIKLLRKWDVRGANSVDRFVSISRFVAARVRCFYGRKSDVIYPPVADYWFDTAGEERQDCFKEAPFLYAGALVPYKNVEQIVEAFNKNGLKLWIIGSGPLEKKIKKVAASNIIFAGRVSDAKLLRFYKSCRALVFAAKEDFGLIPIEALAAGKPVIAGYAGALKESLLSQKYWDLAGADKLAQGYASGVFFKYPPSADEINKAIAFFRANEDKFQSSFCRQHAMRFSQENFRVKWQKLESELFKEESFNRALNA